MEPGHRLGWSDLAELLTTFLGDTSDEWVGLYWLLEARRKVAGRRWRRCRLRCGWIGRRLIGRWRVFNGWRRGLLDDDDRWRGWWWCSRLNRAGQVGQAVQLGDLEANYPAPL